MSTNNYEVNLWGSDPDEGNDDCWCGIEGLTKEQALAVYANPETAARGERAWHSQLAQDSTLYIQIAGTGLCEARLLKVGKASADDDDWRRENAMQAGMAFGCDGYNDAMGW